MRRQSNRDKELSGYWKALRFDNAEIALKEIFHTLYADLFYYAQRLSGRRELARDALQNCFSDLWQYRNKLAPDVNVRAYMFRSARNHTIALLRKERITIDISGITNSITFSVNMVVAADASIDSDPGPFIQLLNTLTPRQKEILYLRYYEDLSFSEIAEVLNIKYQSAVNHAHKGIKQLRTTLENRNVGIAFFLEKLSGQGV